MQDDLKERLRDVADATDLVLHAAHERTLTMTKPYPALCRECKWSRTEKDRDWYLRCVHPIINANDSWALSRGNTEYGSDTQQERSKTGWFAKCGRKGKLWEPK